MQIELTEAFLEQFKKAIAEQDARFLLSVTEELFPADISAILYECNAQESKYVIQLLQPEVSADIISNLEPDVRESFLKLFSAQEIAQFVDYMDSDDAADLLNELPLKSREEVMASIAPQQADYITDLLHYEPDCAGGLMAKEMIKANINWTVKQCIEEIRRQAEEVEKIYSVYVVDDNDILLGRLQLKRIIIAPDHTPISELYMDDVIAVESYKDGEEVASIMQKYDLEAIPVINVRGKLLGRITIDDIVDLITEQAEKDLQVVSGISEDIEEDDSVWLLSRARLPWLLIGMIGGLAGARFIGMFEQELSVVPAMAFFIPLITATGGNVGIQSSTIIVQSLASDNAFQGTIFQRLMRVLLVAIINGLVISAFVFGLNLVLFNTLSLSVVVSVALFAVVQLASVMGTVTPLVLDRFGINPALASGPFITTANDLLGLAVYFGVAKMLYSVI